MSKESKLMKNTAIIAIGNICTKCISFFMLPLYTALLSTEEYGTVDMINIIVSLSVIVLTFQLEQGIFRYLIEARENVKKEKEYISTTLIFILLVNILCTLVFAVALNIAKNQYTLFVVSAILANVAVSFLLQIPRGLGNNVIYAIGSCISGSLNVIFNVLFIVILGWKVEGMLVSSILAQAIASIYIVIKLRLWTYISIDSFNRKSLNVLLKYSAPLIPSTLCWWVINASDRLVINAFLGVAANGIYSVAYKFPTIFSLMTNIFQVSWAQSAAENVNDKDMTKYYQKIMDSSVRLYSSANIGIIAILPFFFNVLVGKNFEDAYFYIPLLMTGALFHGIADLYGSIYTALKMTKEIAKTTTIAAIINLVVNLLLIKKIGLYAAAISTVLAYPTITIIRHFDIMKKIVISYRKGYLFTEVVVYLVVFLAYYSRNYLYQGIALIILIPYCIVQNFPIIKSTLVIIKSKLTINKQN